MDFIALSTRTQLKAMEVWQSLTPEDFYNAWLASGVVLFLALAWISYRIMRKALGHTKFRGTWYNEHQFEELIRMIDEDVKCGNRVMKADEMRAVRKWRFGSEKSISDRASGYF